MHSLTMAPLPICSLYFISALPHHLLFSTVNAVNMSTKEDPRADACQGLFLLACSYLKILSPIKEPSLELSNP